MLLIPFLMKNVSSVEYCTKIVDLDRIDEEAIDKKWSVVANQLIEESEHAGHDRDAKVDQVKCSTQCDGFLAGRFFDKMFHDFLQLCVKYFSRIQ